MSVGVVPALALSCGEWDDLARSPLQLGIGAGRASNLRWGEVAGYLDSGARWFEFG